MYHYLFNHAVKHSLLKNTAFVLSCLSYDVASGRKINTCIKIDKPQLVYRFLGNIMK